MKKYLLVMVLVIFMGCVTTETSKLRIGMTTQEAYDKMGPHTTARTLDYKSEWADLWVYERIPPERGFEALFLNDKLIKWNYSSNE